MSKTSFALPQRGWGLGGQTGATVRRQSKSSLVLRRTLAVLMDGEESQLAELLLITPWASFLSCQVQEHSSHVL